MTTDARDRILSGVRAALRGARLPDAASAHPGSFPDGASLPAPGDPGLIRRFGEELEALHGVTYHVRTEADAAAVALEIVTRNAADRVLSWSEQWLSCPGLIAALKQAGVRIVGIERADTEPTRREQLEAIEPIVVGLTGALAGLADTGSLVLAAGPGRSRLASLLPPVHIAVLPADRVYATLPAFLAASPGVAGTTSNLVLVTGPSRTADIEMTLTHGVHGPREVHVIVVRSPAAAP
jgi:L-lactate dehydrogenase complex protein LldG